MKNLNIVIRKINLYDLIEMHQDENSSFHKNYSQGLYSYLDLAKYAKGTFQVAIDITSNLIVGIIQYDKNNYRENDSYSMLFVSVIPEYQSQGWASKLIEAMIIDLIGKTKNIELSHYSSEGEKLIPTTHKLSWKYKDKINIFHRLLGQEYINAINPLKLMYA